MNLERTLSELARRFHDRGVRYGLIGGFAVALHGHPRTTVDLDFLVDRDHLPVIDRILEEMDYELAFRTENVSQYAARDGEGPEIDLIHAFRTASRRMLDLADSRRISPDGTPLNLLRVEDIIGLKVQAMANDPSREAQDRADIQRLVALHTDRLDWELLTDYLRLFDREDLLRELRGSA